MTTYADCIFAATGNGNEKACIRPGCTNRTVTPHPPEMCHSPMGCLSPESGNPPMSERDFEHGAIVTEPPSIWRKAANFAKAALRQAPLFIESALTADESAALRSHEEVQAIFEICQRCELFAGGTCTHKSCGCAIDADKPAYFSKIAWKSQRCPKEPPLWT